MNGVKTSVFGIRANVFDLIREVADRRRMSAVDLGGISLPSAVDYISGMTNKFLMTDEAKLRGFFTYALNTKNLALFIESVFNDNHEDLLQKYYEPTAIVRRVIDFGKEQEKKATPATPDTAATATPNEQQEDVKSPVQQLKAINQFGEQVKEKPNKLVKVSDAMTQLLHKLTPLPFELIIFPELKKKRNVFK